MTTSATAVIYSESRSRSKHSIGEEGGVGSKSERSGRSGRKTFSRIEWKAGSLTALVADPISFGRILGGI